MSKFSPIINSFTRGQLTPWMKGRVDVEGFYKGAEDMTNMLVRPFGGAMRAPGTEFIEETKDSSKTAVLIPFIFSSSQAYAIEAGDLYFRFFIDGGILESGGSPVEVVSPYSQTEVESLQWAQSLDVLYLVHANFRTRKLARTGPASWTLTTETFFGGPFLEDNNTATTITPSATTGTITLTASSGIFESGHVGSLWKIAGTTGSAPAVQGYVRITAYSSSTSVTAEVVETLSGTGATTSWAEGAWSDVQGYPTSVTFHEGRLWYGKDNKVWGSRPFIYDDFTEDGEDDGAVSRELPTRKLNIVEWLSSETRLVVGTDGGEFTIGSGSNSEAITPSNITAINRTVEGSEPVIPVRIRNRTYFVQREGRKVLEFYYLFEYDNYDAKNPTLFAENVTGTGIRRMALQQNEDNILWAVTNDGNIATMTRELDQQVTAWCPHTTDGEYESICVTPRDGQFFDDIYVIVKREINGVTKRYVEIFKNPRPFDESNYLDNRLRIWYVHSGLSYDTFNNTLNDSNSLTLSAITGDGITATSSQPIFSSDDVSINRIRAVDSDGNTIGEANIVGYTSDTEVTVNITVDFDSTTYPAGMWGKSETTLSGLDHLEAKQVDVIGDGNEATPKTVTSGSITMDNDYFIVITGLHYDSTLKLFPLEGGGETGTSQGRLKRINRLAIRFYKTVGALVSNSEKEFKRFFIPGSTKLGQAPDYVTGINSDFYPDFNNYEAQVTILQKSPLPMNVLGVMPFVVTHDV